MSSTVPAPRARRGLLIKLAVLAVGVAVVGVLVLRGMDVRGVIEQALAQVRAAGPWAFFGALAVLPAFGCPATLFTVPAAPAFSGTLGIWGVMAAVSAALAVNVALTYWLARYALRPLAEAVVKRLGYALPVVPPEHQLTVTLLVRITPGPPFFMQGYLLGLAAVPFWSYLLISWVVASVYSGIIVFFGESIMHGRAGAAVIGVSLFVVVGVVVHLLRKRLARQTALAASPGPTRDPSP